MANIVQPISAFTVRNLLGPLALGIWLVSDFKRPDDTFYVEIVLLNSDVGISMPP